MKKFLKYLGIFFLVLIIGGFIAVKVMSEALPQGQNGPAAEQLAQDVLTAIHDDAMDSTKWLQWEFIGGHQFIWNQESNTAQIAWGDNKVIMQLDKQTGEAYINGIALSGDEKKALMDKAWAHWCNDSFWLMAPNKVKDRGTERSIVDVSEEFPGQKGLLVQYKSGGVTPGDAYLWILGPDNIPTGYKMWTSIIPVKGVYTSWEDWITLSTGAKLATTHNASIGGFSMENVKGGQSWSDLELAKAPF